MLVLVFMPTGHRKEMDEAINPGGWNCECYQTLAECEGRVNSVSQSREELITSASNSDSVTWNSFSSYCDDGVNKLNDGTEITRLAVWVERRCTKRPHWDILRNSAFFFFSQSWLSHRNYYKWETQFKLTIYTTEKNRRTCNRFPFRFSNESTAITHRQHGVDSMFHGNTSRGKRSLFLGKHDHYYCLDNRQTGDQMDDVWSSNYQIQPAGLNHRDVMR